MLSGMMEPLQTLPLGTSAVICNARPLSSIVMVWAGDTVYDAETEIKLNLIAAKYIYKAVFTRNHDPVL